MFESAGPLELAGRFVLGAAALLGGFYIFIPFAVLIVVCIVQAARLPTNEKRKLAIAIFALPIFWVFAALWGGFFFIEPNRGVQPDWVAAWVGLPLLAMPIFYVIDCFVVALRLPESGVFLLPYAIVNLYFVITVSFISMMAVGGTWL